MIPETKNDSESDGMKEVRELRERIAAPYAHLPTMEALQLIAEKSEDSARAIMAEWEARRQQKAAAGS